jgi:hypothetical protein
MKARANTLPTKARGGSLLFRVGVLAMLTMLLLTLVREHGMGHNLHRNQHQ